MTPPVETSPLQSPPASPPALMRQRAVAQLRPVSIPEIVADMAGKDPLQKMANFDRHYMPDGQPAPENWATILYLLFCQTNSHGTCMSFMPFDLKA